MRVLVAIAHHGTKNRPFLLRMLDAFDAMDHQIDVVVVCEERKDLPPHVEQIVGLPSPDPWSLPFAHRRLFVERADDYDLFVYSEDDTLIEQRHLDAFLELQDGLPDDLVTGFMRYEEFPEGARSYCTVHSHYRWLPGSARRMNGLTFARFTNDHAACYALTRGQLRRAIRSGGFDVEPHAGRYDMLVTAATDVYTQCGMTKYLCIDRIEDQLVHHMPNVYLGKLGADERCFRSQLSAVEDLPDRKPDPDLLTPETSMLDAFWDRHSFAYIPTSLVDLFTERPSSRVLSVGGTTGDLEVALQQLGHEVVSIPTDAVFARILQDRGVATLSVDALEDRTNRQRFDQMIAIDVLPYIPQPVELLAKLRACLARSGRLMLSVPDHRRYRLRNRIPGQKRVPTPTEFASDGSHPTDPTVLRQWCEAAGFQVLHLSHRAATRREPFGIDGWGATVSGNVVAAVVMADR